MNLKGKKILVTGADGFIGSHLTEELIRNGYEVRAFVYYNSFNSWGWLDHCPVNIKEAIDVFPGDLRDQYVVKTAMRGCGAVLHLGALVGIPYSYQTPGSYIDTNIKGTLNILEAARELEVEKIVHTSTSEVYGTALHVPISENHPLRGQSPYAASKVAADQMALAFHHSYSTPVAIIRPFNTYGPRQSARAVLPTIITQVIRGESKLRLGALSPTRDFSYIQDTVRGFIEIAKSTAAIGEVINIGSGFELSIGEAVEILAEVMGVSIETEIDVQRLRPEKSEVHRLWADTEKARRLLGWSSEYSGRDGFRRGLQKTVQWFMRPENQRMYKCNRYNV